MSWLGLDVRLDLDEDEPEVRLSFCEDPLWRPPPTAPRRRKKGGTPHEVIPRNQPPTPTKQR